MNEDTRMYEYEFVSECRLQTRLTTYKCKNAIILFVLRTTCVLS